MKKTSPQATQISRFIKTPYKRYGRPRCYIYEGRGFWRDQKDLASLGLARLVYFIKLVYRKFAALLSRYLKIPSRRPHLKVPPLRRAVVYLRNLKPRWEYVVIALLLGLLFARPAGAIIHDAPGAIAPAPQVIQVKPKKPLKVPKIAHIHTVALQPVAPVYVAPPAPVGVTNCGSDPNMAYIYQHESGCRTNAIGPNGPCGLGQALPCSKLPCSLSDWTCQNNWFTQYCLSTYGSTYNCYIFWVNHHWC